MKDQIHHTRKGIIKELNMEWVVNFHSRFLLVQFLFCFFFPLSFDSFNPCAKNFMNDQIHEKGSGPLKFNPTVTKRDLF